MDLSVCTQTERLTIKLTLIVYLQYLYVSCVQGIPGARGPAGFLGPSGVTVSVRHPYLYTNKSLTSSYNICNQQTFDAFMIMGASHFGYFSFPRSSVSVSPEVDLSAPS